MWFKVHGCLLRLERPGEVKSYLVDTRFTKRAEAKSAVCLLAMSQGVGSYIRGVGKAVEDKLSPQMRRYISEVLLPALNSEYRKLRGAGVLPPFEYEMELDGLLPPVYQLWRMSANTRLSIARGAK